ncbi:MAG TPA: glycoside hydrolase family 3 N-terminal domain-containing protein, partial [Geminicoccaceae bacterium]|nr:glycoside hydrolase family 3 N-terminal domain-containing protein [Geminicoccaceae bacterium]
MRSLTAVRALAGLIGAACCSAAAMAGAGEAGPGAGETRIERLLRSMTLEEKVGQLNLLSTSLDVTGPRSTANLTEAVRRGAVGAVFNAFGAGFTRELQRLAVEETRLGVPLLMAYDVIHGYRTIFPIPLGQAASFDLGAIERAARVAAEEATAAGVAWTFAPMVDVARDPRWGRIAEGAGEDPYLGALVAAAAVRGYQGDDLAAPDTLAATVKHFAGYGAAEAGRDYNTVDLSERRLREVYLPPFEAGIEAGVAAVMPAFNELNGVPATADPWLLTDLLRGEWGFDGLLVSDYNAVAELIPPGVAADGREAAAQALLAGLDMDMQSEAFVEALPGLV